MRRRTIDSVLSFTGLAMAALLLLGGGLAMWASTFISSQVHDQLAAQQIYFPKAGSDSLKDPKVGPYLNQYAGQQLTTGAQAKAYANHYIAVHIAETAGGKTYSQLSTEARANPDDTKIAEQVQTVFRGETLRGLLLNAYAFGEMAVIAMYTAIVAFVGAAVFLVLAALGFIHRARLHEDPEFVPGAKAPAPVEA